MSMNYIPDPLPTCAICRRPVDRISCRYDIARQATIYTAYCHGDSETVYLGDVDIMLSTFDGISFGVAFGTPRLGAPVYRLGPLRVSQIPSQIPPTPSDPPESPSPDAMGWDGDTLSQEGAGTPSAT